MANQIESLTNNKPVALVTGANQGVGFQIAKALANNGYIVYLGSRNLGNGEKAAAEIGIAAHAIQLDVTQQSTINAAVERIEKESGHLDLLVNNAAISHAGKPGRTLEETSEDGKAIKASLDEVRTVWETNVSLELLPLHKQHCPYFANQQLPVLLTCQAYRTRFFEG
ncbi:Putative dehydrogenase [Pedobacter cryoconitis]|uniref:Putative dehydrogenase n=1 Tax=Pedobacter cryoconitis TaxID=188932 RepID=A0A127VE11_9SPHI|nr:SDR family NAD(P)-dependent oxidoreductase [Pedobacter cryoconitis]AMP99603.1 Putative dehydrogenase [Pedobacter cryoconitis]